MEGNTSQSTGAGDTQDASLEEAQQPWGTNGGNLSSLVNLRGDLPLKCDEILQAFALGGKLRFKNGSRAFREYCNAFRRFFEWAKLEQYTPDYLTTKDGQKRARQVVLGYLGSLPPLRRAWYYAALQTVWEVSLDDIPWPVKKSRDIGKGAFPKYDADNTPQNFAVEPYYRAATNETDPYTKVLALMVCQMGWRPSDISSAPWNSVQWDVSGRATAIKFKGERKTESPICAHLPKDMAEALSEWRKVAPNANGRILPNRNLWGVIEPQKVLTTQAFDKLWHQFRKTRGIQQKLTPKDFRHFVKTSNRKMGLSERARAAYQGHSVGLGMDTQYDNPTIEEVLDEQAVKIPDGPCAVLAKPKVSVDMPYELGSLWNALNSGEMDTLEMAQELAKLRKAHWQARDLLSP